MTINSLTEMNPTVFIMLGYPGAGKTFFARQFAEEINAIHIHEDRIRSELFDDQQYTKSEDDVVYRLVDYMLETTLKTKKHIVVDGNNSRIVRRKQLRELVRKSRSYNELVVWVQTDINTALYRSLNRDRRGIDDKYSRSIDEDKFNTMVNIFKRPDFEHYVVVSGRHVFNNQLNAVVSKLRKTSESENKSDITIKVNNNPAPPRILGGRVDIRRRII